MGKNRKQRIRSAILDEYKKGNNWLDASEKIQKMFGFNNETCPTTIKLWYDKFYLGDESLENDPLKEEKKAAKAAKKVTAQPAPVSPITQVLNNETQAKMLFELKEQVDLLYRKINTQERCLKLTDRYVKSLTKSNNNCISPDSVMDQQKKAIDFKRNYRLLRRKCNKLQSKVEANNFYENFYSKLEAACKEEKKRKAREAKKKKTNTKTTTSKTGRKRGRPCTVKPVEKKRAKVSKEDREPADCEQCGRSFRNPERLDTHMKQVHKPAERHYCSFEGCEVNYLSKAHLTRHMRVAHPKENQEFPCTWADCTFVANSSATLAKHVNGHSGDPPFKCLWPDCDYACSLVSNLDKHTAMHERKQNLLMEIENENEIPEANQRFNDPATIINDPGPIDISKCQVPNVELVENLLIRNDQQQQQQQQHLQQQQQEFVHSQPQQQQLQQQLQQQQQLQ